MMLADALLRRKELQMKVEQLINIKDREIFSLQFKRKKVTEDIDDIEARVPKLELNQVTQEFDYYANKLRLIDAAIQQLNWTTAITVTDKVWVDFAEAAKSK